jgi:hypothetical protein
MGFFDDVKLDLKCKAMERLGIRSADDLARSCVTCAYWDRFNDYCKAHDMSFSESNVCSNWQHR